jgi:hypothetical protein
MSKVRCVRHIRLSWVELTVSSAPGYIKLVKVKFTLEQAMKESPEGE